MITLTATITNILIAAIIVTINYDIDDDGIIQRK